MEFNACPVRWSVCVVLLVCLKKILDNSETNPQTTPLRSASVHFLHGAYCCCCCDDRCHSVSLPAVVIDVDVWPSLFRVRMKSTTNANHHQAPCLHDKHCLFSKLDEAQILAKGISFVGVWVFGPGSSLPGTNNQ